MPPQPPDLSDFYPRPPRGGRPVAGLSDRSSQNISIHALREEGDMPHPVPAVPLTDFYPRPPRGGRLCRWFLELRSF